MANVLSELFGDIANAIREKTGSGDTMKPAQFPEAILGIEAGGGVGSSNYKYTVATFKPTSAIATVSHNLGYVPDLIIVYAGFVPSTGILNIAYGFSKAMMDRIENAANLYPAKVGYCTSATQMMNAGTNLGFDVNGADATSIQRGCIRGVTDTTFTVGSTSMAKMGTAGNYTYVCISGITG